MSNWELGINVIGKIVKFWVVTPMLVVAALFVVLVIVRVVDQRREQMFRRELDR